MQLGIALPTSAPNPNADLVLEYARIADQGGLDSVWVIDRVVFPLLEALTSLAAVASVTSRVKLGTDVLLGPTRDPVVVASQVASIDAYSHGRMILGVGVGGREEDYTVTGRDYHTRGRRMGDDVVTMRRVWAGESLADGYGRTGPLPVQGSIPVLFGGSVDAAMARAARLGDGHLLVPRGVEVQRGALAKFRQAWLDAGRSGQPIVYAQAYCSVNSSPEQGREDIVQYQAHYYGGRPRASGANVLAEEFDLVGPPEVIAEGLLKYEQLGVDGMILFPARADAGQAEAIAGPVREMYQKHASAAGR